MRCLLIVMAACFLAEPVWSKSLHGGLNDPKSIELKNRKKCEVSTEVAFMSQHGDDESLFDTFFSDPLKCEGTVVEIGGLNGKMFSNSWFFQYALNWRALLVEASPANYANMIKNRPDAININGAVCTGTSIKFRTGKVSAVGGTVDDMSEQHKKRWTGDRSVVIDVPCVQLSDVLKNNGISHVDIFYLDVEGGELSVLNTFDWSIPIDMINVELDGTNEEKDELVRTLLLAHGYIAPFSVSEYCQVKSSENMRRKYKACGRNELFVLETFWNEWKGFKAST